MTVCTGNICRSPVAAQVLRTRLSTLGVRVDSAGTRPREGMQATHEAVETGVGMGAVADELAQHRARRLKATDLEAVDLTVAMAREHRREVVELAPAQMRRCFTAREFARLTEEMSDAELLEAASNTAGDPHSRLAGALAAVNARRGLVLPPMRPNDDDVVDPYRRSRGVYEQAARQLEPALIAVERVVRLVALGPTREG
ncbi:arsenate reductase/protein-tyrosine-phosphatase family protein [Microbacterium sp. Leaf151]|uniref:arsenate reductase/protein-tyrosine-phosphatase family protein n=1 Tax=Microbacterium sp. Leaf151 TaxID=1736276 RepID=UPI0006FCA978|nr:protein-tyrosine-phosphatase [Microbacterium sp. Leaf151]KQR25471.1 protein tyrosine phosphatase [Microbacterium sp. Leaf151]